MQQMPPMQSAPPAQTPQQQQQGSPVRSPTTGHTNNNYSRPGGQVNSRLDAHMPVCFLHILHC